MTSEQLDNIRQIAAKYDNFQCVPCSEEIQEYLKAEQIGGKLIKISTKINNIMFG